MAGTSSPGITQPTAQQQANLKTASIVAANQAANKAKTVTAPTAAPVNTPPPAQAANNSMASFFAPAQFSKPSPSTVINPGIPGQPFMGNNSQQANQQANTQAGTGQTGQQVQGVATQTPPVQPRPPKQEATAQQSAPIQQPYQAQQQSGQQGLNQIAPQAILGNAQTQQAQQNNLQTQAPQYQQPQVGGFPLQQTAPQLAPTGNIGTPQTVTETSSQPAPTVDPNAHVQAFNNSTGQVEQVSPDDPRFGSGQLMQNPIGYQTGQSNPQQNIADALQAHNQQDFSSMLQAAMQAGPNASGADLLKANLQQQLGAIDDPNINTYLNNQIARTQQAYQMGMGYNSASSSELQAAINGSLTSPQTVVGTQAKQAQQAKDLNLQSISAQSAWNQAQQAATVDQLQTKRSDLEGYLKAQLALSAGSDSGPSTAALTVMSQSLHAADINMTLQGASFTFGQNQLAIQGSQVMNDYTNQIMTLGAQVNTQRMQVTSDYYDGLSKIDQNALANEQQKRQLTATAYGTYSQQMLDLNNNQANRQVQYATLAHQTIQDNITDANNLSGITGTVYQPDGKGGFQQAVDQNGRPVQTFDAQKNQFTQALDTAQFQLSASAQNFSIASKAMDVATQNGYLYGDPGFSATVQSIATSLGISPTTMSQYKTVDQLRGFVQEATGNAHFVQGQIQDVNSLKQVPPALNSIFNIGGYGGQCGTHASTLSTAEHVGNDWAGKISVVQKYGTIQNDPQPGYKFALPLGVNTDGTGTGHIGTVISYDPNTGNMLTQESNLDLKGTNSFQIRNVSDLTQKYGSNWGFIPGQFQPNIQKQLDGLGQQQIQQSTPPQPNMDKIHTAINNPIVSGNDTGGGAYSQLKNSTNPLGIQHARLAEQLASGAMSIADVTASLGSGNPGNSVFLAKIQNAASEINPKWNSTSHDFATDWQDPKGANGSAINSFNTAIKHLGVLSDVYSKMSNAGVTNYNEMKNYIKEHLGDPNISEYKSIVNGVADEVAKASTGGSPSVADKAESAAAFDESKGPAAMMASIKGQMDLMGGKTNTLIESYNKKMGSYPTGTFDPEALKAFQGMGMDPSQFDPSLRGTTGGGSTASAQPSPYASFAQNLFSNMFTPLPGNQNNNFTVGNSPQQPVHKDTLQLGVGGDSLGIL